MTSSYRQTFSVTGFWFVDYISVTWSRRFVICCLLLPSVTKGSIFNLKSYITKLLIPTFFVKRASHMALTEDGLFEYSWIFKSRSVLFRKFSEIEEVTTIGSNVALPALNILRYIDFVLLPTYFRLKWNTVAVNRRCSAANSKKCLHCRCIHVNFTKSLATFFTPPEVTAAENK